MSTNHAISSIGGRAQRSNREPRRVAGKDRVVRSHRVKFTSETNLQSEVFRNCLDNDVRVDSRFKIGREGQAV